MQKHFLYSAPFDIGNDFFTSDQKYVFEYFLKLKVFT